jgi:LPS sulfotransferase NodH
VNRNRIEVLNALVASEVEVIRSRDPELSSELDVPVENKQLELPPTKPPVPQLPPLLPGRIHLHVRRVYRLLKRFAPLRPVLIYLRTRLQQFQSDRLARARQRKATANAHIIPALSRSYTIAFTMRSGSNEICNLLGINRLGIPGEFFQKPLSSDPAEFVKSFRQIVSQNQVGGVFGSKMSHDHRAMLDEQLRGMVAGYRGIDSLLPAHRWIWLKREDKVLQAISWCRAEASNQWAVMRSDKVESPVFSYDFFHVLSRVMMIYVGELAWEVYFREHKITPFVICYEEFFRDVDRQLPHLVDYLGGLPPGRTFLDKELSYKIQRNKQSYAMRERFISDLSRIGEKSIVENLGEPLQRWSRFMFEYGWRAECVSTTK